MKYLILLLLFASFQMNAQFDRHFNLIIGNGWSGRYEPDKGTNGSDIKFNSFVNASFIDALIDGSEVRNCDFSNANLSGIEISTSEFRNNKIENTNWQHASFKDTQFTEITFIGLMEDCSFSSCAFSKVIFKNATIKNSFFKYCDLKRVEFIDCHADKLSYEFLKNCKANLNGLRLLE